MASRAGNDPAGEDLPRRYRLIERIAVGGTAEVFRAALIADGGEERPVVIKRVLPQFARDERFRRLFHEEACVAVTVSHPNIVRLLDHGELGQTCYIALELVEGKDLGTLLSAAAARGPGGRPSPPVAAYIAAQVGDALQFIHGRTSSEGTPLRIIHRDVSPQNILVAFSGDVKLTDFGIAKSAIRRDRTMDGTLRGKLDYMAPEQAALGEVDERTDLFALGCVLYELLEGTPPFRSPSEIETIERVRSARLVRPVAELAGAPQPLREVLERLLALDPAARYRAAAELVADLRVFIVDFAPSGSAAVQLGDWARELGGVAESERRGSAADEAVRSLLGEASEPAPSAALTSVFARASASAGDREGAGPDSGVGRGEATPGRGGAALSAGRRFTERSPAAPTAWRRSPKALLLVIAGLALAGWLLLGFHLLRSGDERPPATPGEASQPGLQLSARVGPRGEDPPREGPVALALASSGAAGGETGGERPGEAAESSARRQHHATLVTSSPPGALLFVDGERFGPTPQLVTLPAGGSPALLLEVRRPGFRPWRRRLERDTAPEVLRAVLTRAQAATGVGPGAARLAAGSAYLTINSLPWSRVRLDGRISGNTPLVRLPVRPGNRRIELLGPDGSVRKSFVVTLSGNESKSFAFDFTR